MRVEGVDLNLKFDEQGLIPAIAQDDRTGQVLMLAYMNRESLKQTLETGLVHYFSRERKKLWKKGETSGHLQHLRSLHFDCDLDALLLQVEQEGPACHTDRRACFFHKKDGTVEEEGGRGEWRKSAIFREIFDVILSRKDALESGREDPESYVQSLFKGDSDKLLKKIGEEASEVILAAKGDSADRVIPELADLWFHTLVLLAEAGKEPEGVFSELERRFGKSGILEKKSRPTGSNS